MKKFDAQEYLYMLDAGDPTAMAGLSEIANWRCQTTQAGEIVTIRSYPIHTPGSASGKRAKKTKPTREAQEIVNQRNVTRKIDEWFNANFSTRSLHITSTYSGAAPDISTAMKNNRNYLARLRREFKREQKAGLIPEGEAWRWMYVIEYAGTQGEPKRIHHHIVCNCVNRDACEDLWQAGFCNADRVKPDAGGLIALAKYLTKSPSNKRRWAKSRNLKKPRVSVADKKLSRRRAAAIIEDIDANAKAVFLALYPNCEYIECKVTRSPFVQGAYLYARLRKRKDGSHEKPIRRGDARGRQKQSRHANNELPDREH